MYLAFAWRYFKAKKSANAINIIAWVSTGVIAFATCCQILVLSVFNGFEDLVKSLYSSFYTDLKIVPSKGKTFFLTPNQMASINKQPYIRGLSMVVQEKALIQNGEVQTVVNLKGVDSNFAHISGVPQKITNGHFYIGNASNPGLVVGFGLQNAAAISLDDAFPPQELTILLPKKNSSEQDPTASVSESMATANGVFTIQQDFDNSYAITNLDFIKEQMGLLANEFTAAEITLKNNSDIEQSQLELQHLLGGEFTVQTRYQQNMTLYNTMRMEKWAIYALLTLILVIAAFNIISSLTMLVLEKKKDIGILQSMGGEFSMILKIFMSEGLLLGAIGALIGITLALIICLLQLKLKLIKLQGGSFLIDYFPVKLVATDFVLVAGTAITIALLASIFPAYKAARQPIELH